MEYHVIIIPVYMWDDLKIKNLDSLNQVITVMDDLFKFHLSSIVNERTASLFSGRIAHVTNEVPRIYDITSIAKEVNNELIQNGFDLKIENAFATNYAIELISNSGEIYIKDGDYQYNKICCNLSSTLFDGMNRPFCYQAALAKIILCDDVVEAKALAQHLGIKEVTEELYIEDKQFPLTTDTIFNFRSEGPWPVSLFSNPIVAVKPEAIKDYHTFDELSYLLVAIHSFGKFYSVVRSMRSISASLEISKWTMSQILDNYETRFCWLQRNFQNIGKDLYKFEQTALEKIGFWKRLTTSFESAVNLYREYGEDFITLEWASLHWVLENERFGHYFTKRNSTKNLLAEFDPFVVKEIKLFSSQITDFWNEFNRVSNNWKDNRNTTLQYHGLLISLIGIFGAIIADTVLTLLKP
jgi:hypothetical protein